MKKFKKAISFALAASSVLLMAVPTSNAYRLHYDVYNCLREPTDEHYQDIFGGLVELEDIEKYLGSEYKDLKAYYDPETYEIVIDESPWDCFYVCFHDVEKTDEVLKLTQEAFPGHEINGRSTSVVLDSGEKPLYELKVTLNGDEPRSNRDAVFKYARNIKEKADVFSFEYRENIASPVPFNMDVKPITFLYSADSSKEDITNAEDTLKKFVNGHSDAGKLSIKKEERIYGNLTGLYVHPYQDMTIYDCLEFANEIEEVTGLTRERGPRLESAAATYAEPLELAANVDGDANNDGVFTIADATIILQSLGNPDLYKLSAQGEYNADIYNAGDGVTGLDALEIQKILARK